MYDLIIIGAGPAGLTAGIYARRANLKTLVLEKENIGGQISSSPLVENYPGFSQVSGAELSNNIFEQAVGLGIDFEIEEVESIIDGKIKTIKTDMGEYQAKAVIIATGAHHKMLGLKNEQDFIGRGIHFCATCDGPFYKDKNVAVVGGGNNAIGNAIYLSNICKKVYVLVRKDKLRCDQVLIDKINKIDNVEVCYETQIIDFVGNELEKIIVLKQEKETSIDVDGVFLSIGLIPNTEFINSLVTTSSEGYIESVDCTTDLKGVFVAGDCRNKEVRQLTTAVNDGTLAATKAINYIADWK